jgi:hypothetical protein
VSSAAVNLLGRWSARGDPRVLAAASVLAAITIAAPWIFLPGNSERLWNPVEQLLGAVWPVAGVALLAWFATAPARTAAR